MDPKDQQEEEQEDFTPGPDFDYEHQNRPGAEDLEGQILFDF